MKFKDRNLRALADMVVGDAEHFPYRSSSRITKFFEECDLDFKHDGSTRSWWAGERLAELLEGQRTNATALPDSFVRVLRVLMHKADAEPGDSDRSNALASLNATLTREGYEAFYAEDNELYIRHIKTKSISTPTNPHRPLTAKELEKR